MMSDFVEHLFKEIGETPSLKEKERILRDASVSLPAGGIEILKETLLLAYDPTVNFGISEPPAIGSSYAGSGFIYFGEALSIMRRLANETVSIDSFKSIYSNFSSLAKGICERIIYRDLGIGIGPATINKVFPSLIPEFPYMRCSLPAKSNMERWDWGKGVIVQEKADGMFVSIHCSEKGVTIRSRQGQVFPKTAFSALATEGLAAMRVAMERNASPDYAQEGGVVFHGEALVTAYCPELDAVLPIPREEGNGVMNSLLKGGRLPDHCYGIKFVLWDVVPESSHIPKGTFATPYEDRLSYLTVALAVAPADSVRVIRSEAVHSLSEAYNFASKIVASGGEGAVMKSPRAIWADKTSKDQVKIKLEIDLDLVVTGVETGSPGSRLAGRPAALTVESACGKLTSSVTIKNEAMRDVCEREDFANEIINRVFEVRCNGLIFDKLGSGRCSMVNPRFVTGDARTDKYTPDDMDRINQIIEAAKSGKAALSGNKTPTEATPAPVLKKPLLAPGFAFAGMF